MSTSATIAPVKPKRPLGPRLLPRPPDVKNAALTASADTLLAAQDPVTCTPQHIAIAANLIEDAASTLPPPPRRQDAPTLLATGQNTPEQAQECSEIRDGAGFRAWVAAKPESRTRAAVYLAECAKTGKLAASMDATGMTVGSLSCLEQRHPAIRAALQLIRSTHARKLVSRAREAVEGVLVSPGDQTIQLRAAGLAMQYGPKGSGEATGDAGEGDGGVQIVINMGIPQAAAVIPMEQVRGGSLFVQSR